MASKVTKETDKEDPILQRLDTLIRLQARLAVSSIKEPRDKVLFLSGAGLGPKAISEMLSMSPNAVSSVLKRARKIAPQKNSSDVGGE
jgi:DNA-directed RNA polymerase specialized sigma24 family protein